MRVIIDHSQINKNRVFKSFEIWWWEGGGWWHSENNISPEEWDLNWSLTIPL